MKKSHKIQIRETGTIGKGFFAKEHIKTGEQLLSITDECLITSDKFESIFEFQDFMYEPIARSGTFRKVLFSYFLAAVQTFPENQKEEHEEIQKYISNLPLQINGLVMWSHSELEKLKNKELVQKVKSTQQKIEQYFIQITQKVKQVCKQQPKPYHFRFFLSPQEPLSIQKSKVFYFYSVLQSRSVSWSNDDQVGALAPNLEMFNHSKLPHCRVEGNYIVISIRQIEKDEQIFVNYGKHVDLQVDLCLQKYGFVSEIKEVFEKDQNYRNKVSSAYNEIYQNRTRSQKQKRQHNHFVL